MLVEQLRKEWRARQAAGAFRETLCFEGDGLVLGAGTVLAKAVRGGREQAGGADGARLRALLSVAYNRRVAPDTLSHIEAAAAHWSDGDEARATLHLALSRVGRLDRPAEAARRLFMADGLMRAGVTPETILDVLEPETTDATALKYSPDQPRVPAGSGRASGEWTSGGAGAPTSASRTGHSVNPAGRAVGGLNVQPASAAIGRLGAGLDLGAMTETALSGLAAFVSGLFDAGVVGAGVTAAGAVSAFGVLFIPSTGPRGQWVHVGGLGNVSYYLNPDEPGLQFKYTTADGVERTFAALPRPDGNYRGPDDRVIARWVKGATRIGLVISTAALVGNDVDRPNLCPAPVPDKPHGNAKAMDYEDYIKRIINPNSPTPRGMGYAMANPSKVLPTTFDDCRHSTGALFEIKSTGFAGKLNKDRYPGKGMVDGFMKQSRQQLEASDGRPVTWIFAEKGAADYVRSLFKDDKDFDRSRIRVVWIPWIEGMK